LLGGSEVDKIREQTLSSPRESALQKNSIHASDGNFMLHRKCNNATRISLFKKIASMLQMEILCYTESAIMQQE
jgi:hypothetical protein